MIGEYKVLSLRTVSQYVVVDGVPGCTDPSPRTSTNVQTDSRPDEDDCAPLPPRPNRYLRIVLSDNYSRAGGLSLLTVLYDCDVDGVPCCT